MAAYSILEAKSNLSALVHQAANGEEVVIAEEGKPALKLVPVEPVAPKRLRPAPGSVPHDFDIPALLKALDEPWSEEEQRAFGMID